MCQDAQRGYRNLSTAWIDVSKAYDSVDHRWLVEMFKLRRFSEWFGFLVCMKMRVIAYWDIPLYADNTHLKANRIDATIVDKEDSIDNYHRGQGGKYR